MCQDLTLFFDCFCSNRVVEIYRRKNTCDCCFIIEFFSIEAFICSMCKETGMTEKFGNIIKHHILKNDVELFYNADPLCCVERVFR